MRFFDPDFVVPFLIFLIPIIAIIGGITTGIVRTMGRQRLIELAQQERIAAIQRGIDPAQLAPITPELLNDAGPFTAQEHERRQHRGLLIGGIVTTFTGVGVTLFLYVMRYQIDPMAWAVGLVPIMIGIGLLTSAAVVRPRNGGNPAGL